MHRQWFLALHDIITIICCFLTLSNIRCYLELEEILFLEENYTKRGNPRQSVVGIPVFQ